MFEKDFCKIEVNHENNTIVLTMTKGNFVDAVEKASQAVTAAIKGRTMLEEMYVAMTFAEALPAGYDFANASDMTMDMENNLPQIRLNGNQSAVQYLCTGDEFNDYWYFQADLIRKSENFMANRDTSFVKVVLDANEKDATIFSL